MDDQSLTLFLTHEHASTPHIRGLRLQNPELNLFLGPDLDSWTHWHF